MNAREMTQIRLIEKAMWVYYLQHDVYPLNTESTAVCNVSLGVYAGQCIIPDCSCSHPDEFFTNLRDDAYISLDSLRATFGADSADISWRACYYYTADRKHWKLAARVYPANEWYANNDGGNQDKLFEVGSDLGMAIFPYNAVTPSACNGKPLYGE